MNAHMTTRAPATLISFQGEALAAPENLKPWSTRKIVALLALGWTVGGLAGLALMNAPVSMLENTMTGIR